MNGDTRALRGGILLGVFIMQGQGSRLFPRSPKQPTDDSLRRIRSLDYLIYLMWLQSWRYGLDFKMSHIIQGVKDVVLVGR